jgi:hypothetical protein
MVICYVARGARMKLETPGGRYFSLTIERYEFPEEELGPNDNPAEDFDTARFLIVSHTFRDANGQWNACGPTMTTSELQRFIYWLDSIRREDTSILDSDSINGVYFTERDLEFSVDEALQNLRVHVSFELLPSWANSAETVTIEFPLKHINLDRVIASLEQQLARFPGRPPIENWT